MDARPNGDVPPAQVPADVEDDADEALGLPLQAADPASKRRRLSGPKLRKTREELLEEEIAKAEARYQEVLSSLADPSSPMPTCAGISKIERVLKTKLEEAKTSSSFASSTALQGLVEAVAALKDAVRVTALYLPASGNPKRAHSESFVEGLKKLDPKVLSQFPGAVLGHYYHLRHQQDMQLVKG